MSETVKQAFSELLNWSMHTGFRLIACLAVLFIGLKLIKWLVRRIKRGKRFATLEPGLQSFLGSILYITLDTLLIVTIAAIVGIPMASFVALLTSCGVAIGLALQGSLSNFAGGIMLLVFRPFKVGDYIEAIDRCGTVTDISVFYTTLVTVDNKTITIPNGTLTNTEVINYSTATHRRVDLTFSVEYGTDIDRMNALLLEVAQAHPLVEQEDEEKLPFARLSSNDDSAMTFILRTWCKGEDYWTVYYDLLETVKKRLDQEQIQIPFPQVEVHTK